MSRGKTKISVHKWRKLFAEVQGAPPTLSLEEMKEIEAAMNEDLGPVRRLALAALTRPGALLLESVKTDRESAIAFAGAQNLLAIYIRRLRQLADLLDKTNVFISVALAERGDIDEIEAEVRRQKEVGGTPEAQP